jgi:NAD(P)-dependent dehydrogenase (short-subunit alcohol dehydrogenase family)
MTSLRSILVTGANSGLGKEAARQLALRPETEVVYLGCRNAKRAETAKAELEQSTGRSIFEIVLVDVSQPASVRAAVEALPQAVDGLIMNAGGMGGQTPGERTPDGVTQLFATNLLGHVVLVDELIAAAKLRSVAIYAGSEAARGVPKMRMKRPELQHGTTDEMASIADGSFFADPSDPMVTYGPVKYMAALWMSSMARRHPDLRFVTVSPGGTSGTAVMDDLPPVMRFIFKTFGVRLMPLMGMMHGLETGAKRYVDVLTDAEYASGRFYASKAPVLTGPMVDQATIHADFDNERYQDSAHEAIHRFVA